MKCEEIRNALQGALDGLKELEERARKLDNQNLADVAKSAWSRVEQLLGHADLELIGDDAPDRPRTPDTTTHIDQAPGGVRQPPFDPKAGSGDSMTPGTAPEYKAAFPPSGGTDVRKGA